ncbi:MAG: hypothetical protein ACI9UK_002605 [Candidatus Krumholzibacteriia bacterium]|jgi:hypothetical protein
MRTVVALVETQPETIEQDYQRVMKLAKLPSSVRRPTLENPLNILADSPGDRFEPGFGVAPWQVRAMLSSLGEHVNAAQVVAVSIEGVKATGHNFLRKQVLDHFSHPEVTAEFLRPHRHVSQVLHPALDEALASGVQLPIGLAHSSGVLLSAPTNDTVWGLSGAVAMLPRIVLGGVKIPRSTSLSESVAESLAVVGEVMPHLSAILDGTLWGVSKNEGRSLCVARNVVLAGSDPLAVDVVAMRLAGIDPQQVPWVRMCQERGLGHSRREEITVAGHTDLLDLDFKLGNNTFGASRPSLVSALTSPLRAGLQRIKIPVGRSLSEGRFGDTVWATLSDEYADGSVWRGSEATAISD